MKLKDVDGWNKCLQSNKGEPYGEAVNRYAETWANLMEAEIAVGKTVADVAEQTSHNADTEGITGFMYGCAVSILAAVWEHGEELRQWHNLDAAGKEQGSEANNRAGVVVNPAIVTITL